MLDEKQLLVSVIFIGSIVVVSCVRWKNVFFPAIYLISEIFSCNVFFVCNENSPISDVQLFNIFMLKKEIKFFLH